MNSLNRKMKHARGFTLIELMIVVAIIAILSVVGIPAYQTYVKKANRADAEQVMMTIASKQQQYLLDARLYTNVVGRAGLNVFAGDNKWDCNTVDTTCSNSRYAITVVVDNAAAPPTYTVTATPTAIQSSDGTLTLLSTGFKSRMIGSVEQGW